LKFPKTAAMTTISAPPPGTSRKEWYRAFYLQSNHWRERRLLLLTACDFRCAGCDANGRLDVHHLSYANLGDEPLSDLMALCRECHDATHELWDQVEGGFPASQIRACLRHFFCYWRESLHAGKNRRARVRKGFNHLPMRIRKAFQAAKRRLPA
jgi:hypothetical protein